MTPTTEQLAATFLKVLQEVLDNDEYAEVCRLNAAETNGGICHSHDFCDANMVMAEAFTRHGLTPEIGDNDDDIALWAAAWDVAFKEMQRVASPKPPVTEPRTLEQVEHQRVAQVEELCRQFRAGLLTYGEFAFEVLVATGRSHAS